MALLERLAKLDSAMQRGLDNGMAFVFGGKVVPAEIEELLKQEAQDNLARGDDANLYSPNVMTVGVSSKDLENLSQNRDLPADFAEQLTRFVRNHGWAFAYPVIVRIAEESGLRTGQLRVSSFIDHEPTEETGFDAIFHEDDGQEDHMTNPNNADEAATTAFWHRTSSRSSRSHMAQLSTSCCRTVPPACTTCRKVPTSSAAATTPTFACQTPVCPVSMLKLPGTAKTPSW